MKLIANTTVHLDYQNDLSRRSWIGQRILYKGWVHDFEPGEGGELICHALKWIVSDPCLALWALRKPEAPTPPAHVCEELVRLYKDCGMKDGDMSGLLGLNFKVLCWNPIPGEFNQGQIYEVEIYDLYGSGTDGFVSCSGYVVDTAQEAVNHFILAT
jgi:hypothetical protein